MDQDKLHGLPPPGVDRELAHLAFQEAKDLIRAMEGTAVSRISVRVGWLEVEVTRASTGVSLPAIVPSLQPVADTGREAIVAPLVGIFYRAPSPGSRPFVEVGDQVELGQVVGIVEAMKVMNQVTSEHSGRVVEIVAGDGAQVQYAQPLLLIDTTEAGQPSAER